MVQVKTIQHEEQVNYIHYEPEVSALCKIGRSPFFAQVSIDYMPSDKLLEFESFEEWLRSLAKTETTIEGLTRIIADKIMELLGDVRYSVTLHATTIVHSPVSVIINNRMPG